METYAVKEITRESLAYQCRQLAAFDCLTPQAMEGVEAHLDEILGFPPILRQPTAVLGLAMAVHRKAGNIDPDVHMMHVTHWQGLFSTCCQLANRQVMLGKSGSEPDAENKLLEQITDQIYTLCGKLMTDDGYADAIEAMAAGLRTRHAGQRA
jgi:hypothetical protein